MSAAFNKLDNPVWYALSELQSSYCIEESGTKFYGSQYCPFGAFNAPINCPEGLDEYAKSCDGFFIVGNKPRYSTDLVLNKELICDQMVIDRKIDIVSEEIIQQLSEKNAGDLIQLVNLVQPGYFRENTFKLGSYFGIVKEGELVALTGERMKMDDFTEVSAVVTHPAHLGKGYAKQLVAHTVNHIIDEAKIPFLHVAETNIAAIRLYEKLGFSFRRKISFWNLASAETSIH
jgi:ribosomal protein S18 acetylase RimI-like enzyme